MKRQVLFSMALVSALTASAQRIDFNLTGRSESQVNEPEYTAWAVNTCETASKEVEDADGNPITITVALVICLTLVVTVFAAKVVGCTLPLLAKKIGFDPAVMASPFITTVVDAISLMIYFNFASLLLGI